MAHEMYGINDLLKQYPLVEKAFERTKSGMEASLRGIGGEMAVIETPKRIIETVVNTIDGTDNEKQALIIGVMYALSPEETLARDEGTFESQYGVEAKTVLDSLLAYDQTSNAEMPTDVARIAAVTNICQLTLVTKIDAEAPDGAITLEMVRYAKDHQHDDDRKLLTNLMHLSLKSSINRRYKDI